jgi:hypothetical protein
MTRGVRDLHITKITSPAPDTTIFKGSRFLTEITCDRGSGIRPTTPIQISTWFVRLDSERTLTLNPPMMMPPENWQLQQPRFLGSNADARYNSFLDTGLYRMYVTGDFHNDDSSDDTVSTTFRVVDTNKMIVDSRLIGEADGAALSVYPNPFDRQTTLRYVLPRDMAVRITVRDLLGREVYRNEPAITEASGEHTRTIVLNDLPDGTYAIVLSTIDNLGRPIIESRTVSILHSVHR